MSEAAHHIPFTETKAPESAERLHRGALSLIDISASTMANIGPAYSFYFGFAGIVIAAGLASPLVVLVAFVAVALLGNTLSQFSRAHPSPSSASPRSSPSAGPSATGSAGPTAN